MGPLEGNEFLLRSASRLRGNWDSISKRIAFYDLPTSLQATHRPI